MDKIVVLIIILLANIFYYTSYYKKYCIDGVEYHKSSSKMEVVYDKNGEPKQCITTQKQ